MKINKVLKVISYVMIGVGLFSFLTGAASAFGFSEQIADQIGGQVIFRFVNGGIYFAICGLIQIAIAALALFNIKKEKSLIPCAILGAIVLAWHLAAFIYLLTLGYLSIRSAAMVLMPAMYFIITSIGVAKDLIDTKSQDSKDGKKTTINTRKNFLNFNFSFKRKHFGGVHFKGKRHNSNIMGVGNRVGKRRRSSRLKLKNIRK